MEVGGMDDMLVKEALRILDDAIELNKKNGVPHAMRARINLIEEKYEEALKDVSNAIDLNEKDFSSLALRASIHSQNQDLDLALEDVTKALELQPNLTEGIRIRALINMQKMEFGKAIPDIRLLSNSNPGNFGLKRQLAMLYNADDQPKRAIAIYDALLKLDEPGSWEGESPEFQLAKMGRRAENLHGRGDSQLSVGGHQEAVDNYTEAMELGKSIRELEASEGVENPSLPDDGVLNNLAWVLATSTDDKVRDGARSIELATLAAEQTEFKQAHIISTLASGYAEAGDWKNAIKWIEKAIEINKAGEEGVGEARQKEQSESLQKEYENYKNEKAWRENQAEEAKSAKDKSADKPVEKKVDDKSADEPDEKKVDDKEDDSDDKESDDKKKEDK
jgi:tetratricopeptide (TPR) repeat protein